jgi:protein-tyrosine-phosphatase
MILKDLLRISSEASTDGWSNVADELTDPAHARENEQYLADIRETVDEIRQLLDKIAGGDKFQKAPDLRVA